jgi:hypothetical protein
MIPDATRQELKSVSDAMQANIRANLSRFGSESRQVDAFSLTAFIAGDRFDTQAPPDCVRARIDMTTKQQAARKPWIKPQMRVLELDADTKERLFQKIERKLENSTQKQ